MSCSHDNPVDLDHGITLFDEEIIHRRLERKTRESQLGMTLERLRAENFSESFSRSCYFFFFFSKSVALHHHNKGKGDYLILSSALQSNFGRVCQI